MKHFNKVILVILVTIFFGSNSCCLQQKITNKNEFVIVTAFVDLGKVNHLSDNFFEVSKIDKKYITSSIHGYNGEKIISFLINDRCFNYNYLRKNILESKTNNIKVKLYCDKFIVEGKEYIVVNRIKK